MATLNVRHRSENETAHGVKPREVFGIGSGFARLIHWVDPPGFAYEVDVIPLKGQQGQVPHPTGCVIINGLQTTTEPDGAVTERRRGYLSPTMIDTGTWRFVTGPQGVDRWCIRIEGDYIDRRVWHVQGEAVSPPVEACNRYFVLLDGACEVKGWALTPYTEVRAQASDHVRLKAKDAILIEFLLKEGR